MNARRLTLLEMFQVFELSGKCASKYEDTSWHTEAEPAEAMGMNLGGKGSGVRGAPENKTYGNVPCTYHEENGLLRMCDPSALGSPTR